MHLRKTLTALAVAAALPSMAMAVGNTSDITQSGNDNVAATTQKDQLTADAIATIDQDGDRLNADINQGRTNYAATIIQTGNDNIATVMQSIAPPSALGTVLITQGSSFNEAYVETMGAGGLGGTLGNNVTVLQTTNSANGLVDVLISGGSNTVNAEQDLGSDNEMDIDIVDSATGNMVDALQVSGNFNSLVVNVTGALSTDNIINTEQVGDNGLTTVNIVDSNTNTVDVMQGGDTNIAFVELTGGGLNDVDITQPDGGDNNTANVIIAGLDNDATIIQGVGASGNTATIMVTGDNNDMDIDQTGCTNCTATETVFN